jgi:hypothetical protein
MNRFEDMVVKNDEEDIPISAWARVQEQILSMLHLHFRLSSRHAHDAECWKSDFEALQSNALARAKEAEMENMAEMEGKGETEDTQDNMPCRIWNLIGTPLCDDYYSKHHLVSNTIDNNTLLNQILTPPHSHWFVLHVTVQIIRHNLWAIQIIMVRLSFPKQLCKQYFVIVHII